MEREKEIREGKFFAVIAYIGFLCIVSLVLKKENKFALHHGKIGLVLFVFEVVAFLLTIIPVFGWLIKLFGTIIFVLLSLLGIFQALLGNDARIPVISDIADKVII